MDNDIHIAGENGLTLCGLNTDEVFTSGPFTIDGCAVCRLRLLESHPHYDKENGG